MTKDQEQFHRRMNGEILAALDGLKSSFDIDERDIDPPDRAEWSVIRGDLKALLLKAYARNHSWINEPANRKEGPFTRLAVSPPWRRVR